MKKHILFILLALLAITVQAQAPAGYYNNANGKTGTELRQALHDIIDNHTTISYSQIWNAFWSTDNKGNGVVWDMYSDIPNGTPPYTYQMGQNQCGEYDSEGVCYNREHSFPQSWFGDQDCPAKTDLHHIFPTDGYVNQQRGNNPYGEVGSGATTFQNGSKLGTCKSSLGYNGTVFEPIDEYKGDFARAIMYMSVRYYTEDENWGSSGMTNQSDIKPWAVTMLLRWNEADPVSQKEIDRNSVIYNDYQGNRNPFIDNPEYARMIWDPNWTPSSPTGGDFVKVTSTDNLENGDYLIVCESNNVAFNGALTNTLNAESNRIGVTINNGTIESTTDIDAAVFTLSHVSGNTYTIQSASGLYIGQTSNANGLLTSTSTAYPNTISFSGSDANIVCSGGAYLRYNAQSGQERFRYYKSDTYTNQQAIQLYKKTETYTITLATVTHGIIIANATQAAAGATITLTATPDSGYELDAWSVTDASNNSIQVTGNQFTMPASNVTVSATFAYVGTPFAQHYYLVTSTEQLVAERKYLIVNNQYGMALGTTQNTNNRSAAPVSISNNTINSLESDVCELELGGSSGQWTLKDSDKGYLYAAGGTSNSNLLKTQTDLTDEGKWTITIGSDGKATIKTIKSSVVKHTIMYNKDNNLFSCYASGQQDVYLFVRSETCDFTESGSVCLNAFDKNIIHSGVTLNASSVMGINQCTDPSLLIIEDGAQLIHQADGLDATLKKNIQAFTDGESDGWYTIAAPFAASTPAGTMIEDDYDLYYYDEDATAEWINYKNVSFDLTANTGYLYAHSPSTTLRMTGTLNSGNYSTTVNLSYSNSNASIKGYNLLGNPTAHVINFTKSANVSDGYYYLNNSETWEYVLGNTVPVGRSFLVKANAEGQTITLNTSAKRGDSYETIRIAVDGDLAYVKLTDGVSMPLLSFKGKHSPLWLNHEGKPYIMLVRNQAEAIDLCYQPNNGHHTLSVDAKGLDLGYLHLIDRLTGADIDLLQNPNYRFESSSSDYKARFQLVFSPNAAESNDNFAFIDADGNLIVTGDGLLQVYDVLGHQLLSGDVHSAFRIPHSAFPISVYVLRLTTSEKVRIQKIIIN